MVTVVIPVRDRATLLAVTLRTVREQTAPPGEVIVADDGSGDGSPEVAARAGARVLRRPPGGWGAAGGGGGGAGCGGRAQRGPGRGARGPGAVPRLGRPARAGRACTPRRGAGLCPGRAVRVRRRARRVQTPGGAGSVRAS